MKETILVTGAAGFVGMNAANYLASEGYNVLYTDMNDDCGRIRYSNRGMRYIPFHLVNDSFETLPSDVDFIIHLAAMPHVDFSIFYPEMVVQNNIASTQNILRFASEAGIPVLVASSVEVYGGASEQPYKEEDPFHPMSPYAASKVACETLTHTYIRCFGLKAKLVRLTNLYGPWQLPDRIIPRNFARLIDGLPLDIQGNVKRDFLYIEDGVRALEAVMKHGEYGEVYNISSGVSTSMQEVGQHICDIVGLSPEEMELFEEEPTNSRGACLTILSDKLQKQLGWRPEVGLSDGLASTYEWYCANASWVRQFRAEYSAVRKGREFIIDSKKYAKEASVVK